MATDDQDAVGCDRWREALSARADGEPPELDDRLLDAHLGRCAECRAFEHHLRDLGGTLAAAPTPGPDLAARVVRSAAAADRRSRPALPRILLGVVAVEVIVLSVPPLVRSAGAEGATHDARHLSAFSIAYAVGLLMVVWRPARARTILPVAGVLAGALFLTAAVDIAEGRVPLTGEAVHLPEMVSVVLVWLLAVPAPERLHRFRRRRPVPSVALRVVGDPEQVTDDRHRDAI